VSDEFTVPLCRLHHHELHRAGNEAAWWQKLNIDPFPVALRLWQHARANGGFSYSEEGITQAPRTKASYSEEGITQAPRTKASDV
jgi:hypothetical protein